MLTRKKRILRRKNRLPAMDAGGLMGIPPAWTDDEGLHALLPGRKPTPQQLEAATKRYQENIRNSPLWAQMVAEFGPEKAEVLLRDFRVELR